MPSTKPSTVGWNFTPSSNELLSLTAGTSGTVTSGHTLQGQTPAVQVFAVVKEKVYGCAIVLFASSSAPDTETVNRSPAARGAAGTKVSDVPAASSDTAPATSAS